MAERNLDFDRIINRKNTDCLKYDFAVKRGMPSDVLPLWVADMDFETSSYIEDALVERSKEGIFGYSEVQTPYFEIVANWMKTYHNWEPEEEWLIKTPGVVFALANDGDEKVLAGLKEYTDSLAVQIYNLNIYLDLDIIAIGGGISQQPILHKYLQRSLDEVLENIPLRKISPYVPEPKITNCRFYNDANLIGALYHFMNK